MHTHVAGSAFSSPPPRVRPSLLALFLAVCGWFSCSLAFNWSSKSLLNVLPRPVTATLVQLFSVMVYVACYSVVDRHSIAAPSRRLLRQMVPLGLVQLSTKLLHQLALSYVSVSSVHTVKVLTPIFTVVLSRVVLGERASKAMLMSLLPIIGGVVLCTSAAAVWSTAGFVFALAGTFAIVSQNVFAKKMLSEQHVNGPTLVFYTDLTAFLCLLPVWVLHESATVLPSLTRDAVFYALTNGLSSVLQTFSSFFVIVHATTLTYAVLNVTKRAILIVVSILYFGDAMTRSHYLGLCIAFAGVSWYTRIKLRERENNLSVLPSHVSSSPSSAANRLDLTALESSLASGSLLGQRDSLNVKVMIE
eukprot:TRINITY_DN1385_c2_g1_i2.p1 TRINITY_DN1385_c2_g1~~TRINITY_DN1385_c2_g1_i2.p1  ORF type:complete len:369 (+),score=49.52 TRINITY_DN1385_c2_g1_i2:25-1107(+)